MKSNGKFTDPYHFKFAPEIKLLAMKVIITTSARKFKRQWRNTNRIRPLNCMKPYRGFPILNPLKMVHHNLDVVFACCFIYAGVRDEKGHDVYPVGYTWSTRRNAAGTIVYYKHEKHQDADEVFIPGPTNEHLYVYVSNFNHSYWKKWWRRRWRYCCSCSS